MNNENLKPLNTLPKSHQREIQRKGTEAAAEARRRKKNQRDIFTTLLDTSTQGKGRPFDLTKAKKTLEEIANSENITHEEKICIMQILKAETGDTKAAAYIRDTVEGKPATNAVVVYEPSPEQLEEAYSKGFDEAFNIIEAIADTETLLKFQQALIERTRRNEEE